MPTINLELNRDWEPEHFLTFILLYVASSDLSIDDEEISEMETAVKKHTSVNNFSAVYDQVYLVFKFLNKDEQTLLISNNKQHYITDEDSLEMTLSCIEEVIMADLSVEDEEAHAYTALKRILRG